MGETLACFAMRENKVGSETVAYESDVIVVRGAISFSRMGLDRFLSEDPTLSFPEEPALLSKAKDSS